MYEIIQNLCKKKGTNPKQVERALGWANGSLRKTDLQKTSYSRIVSLAEYFGVDSSALTGEPTHTPAIEEKEVSAELQEAYELMADASPEVQNMVLAMLRASKKKYDEK